MNPVEMQGEVVERMIPGVGLLRFENFEAGQWLTAKKEPAKKSRRRYLLDGLELSSVSSVVSALSKELVPWAEQKGIEGTMLAIGEGLINPDWCPPDEAVEIVRSAKLGAEGVRDEAADRGQAVHLVFERLAFCGEPPKLADYPEAWHPWMQGAAKAWLALNPVAEESETIVCHPEHGYAGRFDLIAGVAGRRVLIDYKSGRGRIYDAAHYQTRLYAMALEPSGINPVEDIVIVGIGDDGEYSLVHCEATEQDALALLSVYAGRKRVNAGMAAQRKLAKAAA